MVVSARQGTEMSWTLALTSFVTLAPLKQERASPSALDAPSILAISTLSGGDLHVIANLGKDNCNSVVSDCIIAGKVGNRVGIGSALTGVEHKDD